MKCSEVQDQLSACYDNELPAELRSSADAHVRQCSKCRNELDQFEGLRLLTAGLDQPETPASVWSAIERSLNAQGLDPACRRDDAPDELAPRESEVPAETVHRIVHQPEVGSAGRHFRWYAQTSAAIAATVLVGFVGWTLWHSDHERAKMVAAMDQIAGDIDSDGATTLLMKKFGGREVTFRGAVTQVGYHPVASKGLPEGYSVESVQVLRMPCCQCTQTVCLRPDKTRLLIFEHDNGKTGWFEHRNQRQAKRCGKTCKIVELDNQLVVTWHKDNRHITLLGVRDDDEVELLMSKLDDPA